MCTKPGKEWCVGQLNADSRIIFHRNISDRVATIAPFIRYDADPYLVIADGRLFWMRDAYTVTNSYPYSTPIGNDINYIRNESGLVDERVAQREWELMSAALGRQSSFEQVSSFAPAVAATRTANAIGAVVLSLAGILFYIWIRFGSLRYSIAAIAALCHDVIIVVGFQFFISNSSFISNRK